MTFVSVKSNKVITKFIVLLIICSFFLPYTSPAFARETMWSKNFPSGFEWQTLTSLGVILAGTKENLLAIDEKTGKVIWRKEGVIVDREQVWPIEGTDVVVISDQNKKLGGIIGDANVYALELMSGQVIWSANGIKGRPLDVVPMLEKLSILYITDQKYIDTKTLSASPMLIPHMYCLDINTGAIKWEKDFEKQIQGTKVDDTWLGYRIYNLSGYYRPMLLGDELYLFYSGITKVDFNTGQNLWQTDYPVGDVELVKTDADPIFTDKVIYASGRGQVKAIDRETGKMLWDSDNLGLVPLLLVDNNIIWAQRGGYFYHPEKGEWVARGPFGVTAINGETGKIIWDYRAGEGGLSNILLVNDKVVMADKNHIIALDKFSGDRIYSKYLEPEGPMFAFENSQGNVVFRWPMTVAAYDPVKGIKIWESSVQKPKDAMSNTPFRLMAGVFLLIATGGTGVAMFTGYIFIDEIFLQPEGATSARLRTQFKAEQYYWQNVKTYRNTPGLAEADVIRSYRLTLMEGKKQDPHIYIEGQLPDRKDFIGVVGINAKDGSIDRGVFLGETGEQFIIDYVEDMLFHFDGDDVNCYNLVPR